MAITTPQIHATAEQLQEQGIKPTLAEVRKALGGGSFTTISEAMKSWRQDNQEEEQLRQVELPSGIAERLQALGADMWQTAIDIANDRLVKEREALESIKAKAQAERAKQKTFSECAEAYLDLNRSTWANKKHAQQWENTIKTLSDLNSLHVIFFETWKDKKKSNTKKVYMHNSSKRTKRTKRKRLKI